MTFSDSESESEDSADEFPATAERLVEIKLSLIDLTSKLSFLVSVLEMCFIHDGDQSI